MYDYQAQVLTVHDGDTLKLRVDLGFSIHADMVVRLAAINAPELATPEGKAAQAFADGWTKAHGNPSIGVRTQKDRQEKYGRYLATVYDLADPTQTLQAALLAGGYAQPWDGKGPRPV